MAETAGRRAMRGDRDRSERIADLSHALHIQVQAIAAAGSALGAIRPDDVLLGDLASLLVRASQRLHELHADLLDLTCTEDGGLPLERGRTTMQGLVEHALRAQLIAIEQRRLRIVCSMPSRDVGLRCDVPRMRRALEHLLAHAIEETPRGGEVLLRCTRAGHQVELELAAPALAEEAQSILIEPRRRVLRGETLHADLQLARMLVEAHGGRIVQECSPTERRRRYTLIAPC